MKKLCFAVITMLAASSVNAGSQHWNFGDSNSSHGNSSKLTGSHVGNQMNLTSGVGGEQISLSVSAWASTSSDSHCGQDYDFTNTADDADPCIDKAALRVWGNSGLGIVNKDEITNHDTHAPQHAIDNIRNGAANDNVHNDFDYEMVLLTFSKAVNLKELNIGWSLCGSGPCTTNAYSDQPQGKDGDITVLAHNGSNQTFFSKDTEWSDLTSQGWGFVNNYMDAKSSSIIPTGSSVYSTHWLIGAYNRVFSNTQFSIDNDAFKLAGIKTHVKDPDTSTPVNAPASIGLFALLVGGMLYRRKK